MAVSKAQKQEILASLVEKIKEAKSIGFAATDTVTVDEFASLRASLREEEATYTLAKKTLLKKAVKEALDLDVEVEKFEGQVGIVCSYKDAVGGLGKVNQFIKDNEGKMVWIASIFEGEFKDVEETKVLAGLPSRETLLGRLVGSMKSPISSLARFFDAAAKDIEEKGKDKLGELEGEKTEEAPVETKEETTEVAKAEEVKTETTAEAPAEEAKTEEAEKAAE